MTGKKIGRRARSILTVALVGAFSASGAGLAHADVVGSHANSVAAEIAVVAPDATIVSPTISADPVGQVTSIPIEASGVVAFPTHSGDTLVEVHLPTTSSHASAVEASDGTVVYADQEGSVDVAVQSLTDGVRIQTVVRDQDAATEYSYEFSSGVEPELQEDGSVFLADTSADSIEGYAAGFIQAPWAFDAKGMPVPTHYEVQGTTLIQVVAHDAPGVEYPVVADPQVNYCTLGGFYPAQCIKYTKAETQGAANLIAAGASVGVVLAWLCDKIPHGGIKLACKAIGAGVMATGFATFKSAADKGKCVGITISYPLVAQFAAGGFREANCPGSGGW